MPLSVIEAKKQFNVADDYLQMEAFFDTDSDTVVLTTSCVGWLGFIAPNKPHTQENVLKLLTVLLKASIADSEILSLDMDKEQFTIKNTDNGRVSIVAYLVSGRSPYLSYFIDRIVYTDYAQAKLDNPDEEIVTTGENWAGEALLAGTFEPLTDSHPLDNDTHWVICNPADHCLNLHDFFKSGLELQSGDSYVFDDEVITVNTPCLLNIATAGNSVRFILSAAALNGGCLLPEGELKKADINS